MSTATRQRAREERAHDAATRDVRAWHDEHLLMRNIGPGSTHLPSGRPVFNTGRVLIGKRHANPVRDIGVHAELVQTALLDHQADALRYASPITRVGPTRRERIVDAMWWIVALVSLGGATVWASLGAPLP